MSRRRKMLFKIGVTFIVGVAVYMYFALKLNNSKLNENSISKLVLSAHTSKSISQNGFLEINAKTDDVADIVNKETTDATTVTTHSVKREFVNQSSRVIKGEVEKLSVEKRWKTANHLSVVCCGDRFPETIVMLKSAVLFTKSLLVFHIFTETDLQQRFKDQLNFWPETFRKKFQVHVYNISFPTNEKISPDEWKKLFKPCASQRLFIPALLPDVDSVLYVDTDMLFLSPIDKIWSFFAKFNSTQMAGVTEEHEDKAIGWYNRFARHPYYGVTGINSGVMLMNLTRIRASPWLTSLVNMYKEYRLKITFGDQDLINIYFHFHPDQLYVFSCEWNYRPDHCMYMSVCKPAEKSGAYILHGCRRVWHEEKQPAFKAIYTTLKEHQFGVDIRYGLQASLHQHLQGAAKSNCGDHPEIFLKQIHDFTNTSYPT